MYIIPFKGTLKPKACHISGWAERYLMNKKVKRFFKRNKTQYPRTSGVDLCSVNIVTEAEKIIEDYKNKVKSEENSNDANLKIIYDAIVTDYKNKQYVDCEKRVVEMIGELKKEPLLGQKKRKQYYNQLVVYCSNLKIKIDSNVGESLPNEFKGKISICCASTQEFEKRLINKEYII